MNRMGVFCHSKMDEFGRCAGMYQKNEKTGQETLRPFCFFCKHWDDAVKPKGDK